MKRFTIIIAIGIATVCLTVLADDNQPPKPRKDTRLIVVDSGGTEVGTVVDFHGQGPDDINFANAFALAPDGRPASFGASAEQVDGVSQLWYLSNDCTGIQFIMTNTERTLMPRTAFNPPGKTLYIEQASALGNTMTFGSNHDEFGNCNQETRIGLGVPAMSTALDFSVFVPPFRVVTARN